MRTFLFWNSKVLDQKYTQRLAKLQKKTTTLFAEKSKFLEGNLYNKYNHELGLIYDRIADNIRIRMTCGSY